MQCGGLQSLLLAEAYLEGTTISLSGTHNQVVHIIRYDVQSDPYFKFYGKDMKPYQCCILLYWLAW